MNIRIELPGGWDFAPSLIYDAKEDIFSSWSIGISFVDYIFCIMFQLSQFMKLDIHSVNYDYKIVKIELIQSHLPNGYLYYG